MQAFLVESRDTIKPNRTGQTSLPTEQSLCGSRNRGVRRVARRGLCLLTMGALAALISVHVWGWGSKPHSQIVDAALTVIPPADGLSLQLQGEALNLRNDVQMADWVNSLVQLSQTWQVGTENFPQNEAEYFANDYLIFPQAPHQFNHMVPGVLDTYRPFFLRAVQALRTETPANAGRWMGSLLHFVTDSGSPPHTIGLRGDNHTKMENWLDASQINIAGYHPQLLGSTDAKAVNGLIEEMRALMAKNRVIALRMTPFAQANDRVHLEPLALECATNTAKTTADVIHTLMILARQGSPSSSGSITASISTPSVPAFRLLPAKLLLLNTNYSTLSQASSIAGGLYRGSFLLRNLPPGVYRAAVERIGAETLVTPPFTVANGHVSHFEWEMKPSTPPDNLVRNPGFSLHWVSKNAPDHWHFDTKDRCWVSDNIPVNAGKVYEVWAEARSTARPSVAVQWMQQAWQAVDSAPFTIDPQSSIEKPAQEQAPPGAIYARFRVSDTNSPGADLKYVAFRVQERSTGTTLP